MRLVWTGPAGVDFQTAHYQYRYAAGASVPEETDWTETSMALKVEFPVIASSAAAGIPFGRNREGGGRVVIGT